MFRSAMLGDCAPPTFFFTKGILCLQNKKTLLEVQQKQKQILIFGKV